MSPEALELLVNLVNGDARRALNTIEIAVELSQTGLINADTIKEALQEFTIRYDKNGDEHYDTISAFIKSMRGSDVDASLYYLARMIQAGEDPNFIARRMVIFASEDISNADPLALNIALAVFQACERVGLPECQINLAQGVVYLALAPKCNNSYLGLLAAQEEVKTSGNLPIPLHIRNAPTKLMKNLSYHQGYKYPHDFDSGKVEQQYLPDKIKDRKFYKKEK